MVHELDAARPGTKVLLVEDEETLRQAYEKVFAAHGYRVLAADMLKVAWPLFLSHRPELAVVDLGLPDGSGLVLCKKIRGHEELALTPIIILTAQGQLERKEAGFETGVDQYLVKPLPPEELMLWAGALLRRVGYGEESGDTLRAGDCEIDLRTRAVRFRDVPVLEITSREFDLLCFLIKEQPHVLSRKEILAGLWRVDCVEHVIDTHLWRLRKKLPPELAEKVQAIPGKGFRFLP